MGGPTGERQQGFGVPEMTIITDTSAPADLAFIGSMSIWHWMIVLVVVLLLFGGGGKIPRLMKDLGTGVKSFKKGLKEDESKPADAAPSASPVIENSAQATESKDKSTANG